MKCVNVVYMVRNEIVVGSDKKWFLYNQEQNFSLIRQKTSIDMTLQKWSIFIMGIYGDISHFLSDQGEILFLVIWKKVDTHNESFNSRKQVIKKLAFVKLIWNEQYLSDRFSKHRFIFVQTEFSMKWIVLINLKENIQKHQSNKINIILTGYKNEKILSV